MTMEIDALMAGVRAQPLDPCEDCKKLRAKLDRYTRRSESGESLGDALDMRAVVDAAIEMEHEHARLARYEGGCTCSLCVAVREYHAASAV